MPSGLLCVGLRHQETRCSTGSRTALGAATTGTPASDLCAACRQATAGSTRSRLAWTAQPAALPARRHSHHKAQPAAPAAAAASHSAILQPDRGEIFCQARIFLTSLPTPAYVTYSYTSSRDNPGGRRRRLLTDPGNAGVHSRCQTLAPPRASPPLRAQTAAHRWSPHHCPRRTAKMSSNVGRPKE